MYNQPKTTKSSTPRIEFPVEAVLSQSFQWFSSSSICPERKESLNWHYWYLKDDSDLQSNTAEIVPNCPYPPCQQGEHSTDPWQLALILVAASGVKR